LWDSGKVKSKISKEFVLTWSSRFLQHVVARPHVSARTAAEIRPFAFTVCDYPPYSPEVSPSDFHFLPKLKKIFRRNQYASDDEVKPAVMLWFLHQDPLFYLDGPRHYVKAGENV
jgi:hypothetical protein